MTASFSLNNRPLKDPGDDLLPSDLPTGKSSETCADRRRPTNRYKKASKEKLLELMRDAPDIERLRQMEQMDLAIE
jgi:hypothetical protein